MKFETKCHINTKNGCARYAPHGLVNVFIYLLLYKE
jgi:hypothetical protein